MHGLVSLPDKEATRGLRNGNESEMLRDAIQFDHHSSDVSVSVVTFCFIIACLGRVEARLHIGAGLISRSPNGNATVW